LKSLQKGIRIAAAAFLTACRIAAFPVQAHGDACAVVSCLLHPSLSDHPDHALFEKYFPNGGASIFTFDIKGGVKEAHAFIDALEIFSLLANVADVKSLVIHPATTTHSQLTAEELEDQNIHPNTIRLSIGTEHIDDIIADLEKGFAAATNKA